MRLKEVFSALVLTAGLAMPAFASNADDKKLLTYLADRAEISDLMVTYEIAHNATDVSILPQVFTKDVKILAPDGKVILEGLDNVIANARKDRARFNADAKEGVRTYGKLRSLLSNMDIHVNGNTATTYHHLVIIANNPGAKKPEIVAVGAYDNEYVKTNGTWRISKMVSIFNWYNDDMQKLLEMGPYTKKENQLGVGTYKTDQ